MFADLGIVALREAGDELMRVGAFCRGDDLVLAGAVLPIGNVIADRAAE
jgi:hypothetical protein